MISKLPDNGEKLKKRIAELNRALTKLKMEQTNIVELDDITGEFERVLNVQLISLILGNKVNRIISSDVVEYDFVNLLVEDFVNSNYGIVHPENGCHETIFNSLIESFATQD